MTSSWIGSAYTVVSLIVSGLLVYIMQKVEDDRWSRVDPLWLQWVRRFAFVGTALVLLYSIHSIDWQLTAFLLASAGLVVLFINAMALSLRSPPSNRRGRVHIPHVSSFSYVASKIANFFSAHR